MQILTTVIQNIQQRNNESISEYGTTHPYERGALAKLVALSLINLLLFP